MYIENPIYLYLLLVVIPLLVWIEIYSTKRRKKLVLKFSNLPAIKRISKKKSLAHQVTSLAFYLGLISLFIALANPHLPLALERKGVNFVLVIDTSGSMKANDYKPSRLEAAKNAAKLLIERIHPQDYIGVIAFSDSVRIVSYLTPMKEKVIEKLESIKEPEGKTAIWDAVISAVEMASSIPNKKSVIILLSDGANNAGKHSIDDAIKYAKAKGVQVYAIGMGSEKPVRYIAGYDLFGDPIYSEAVLDESSLKKIAKETNAQYFKSVSEEMLGEIYSKLPEIIKREPEEVSVKDWFIFLAIFCFFVTIYLKHFKYRIL